MQEPERIALNLCIVVQSVLNTSTTQVSLSRFECTQNHGPTTLLVVSHLEGTYGSTKGCVFVVYSYLSSHACMLLTFKVCFIVFVHFFVFLFYVLCSFLFFFRFGLV